MNLEGIVSKRLDAPYASGRGDHWTKAKCRAGHEVVIGGWSTTAGKFRSLLVGVNRGDHLSMSGRVGTGYSADKVKRLMPRLKEMAASASPFTGKGAPRQEPASIGQARTGGGNRICRLDRRRKCASGLVQGLAGRQAG
jgi:bifunctional non-homologous end joining protein LigD